MTCYVSSGTLSLYTTTHLYTPGKSHVCCGSIVRTGPRYSVDCPVTMSDVVIAGCECPVAGSVTMSDIVIAQAVTGCVAVRLLVLQSVLVS